MSENREAKARSSLEKARAGQAAVKRLSRPVRGWIGVAQLLTVASAALGVVPYIALVRLGDLLLSAYRTDSPVDADRARGVLMLLLAAYGARLGLYFVALLLTHVADLKMRDGLRRSIVERLSRAPLAWFSDKGSGAVRKAVQDDASMVHTVIAHGPVDKTNALVSPLALLVYVFTLDWRLGLLSICTVPMYGLTYSLTLRGMAEKTAEMDEKLERVSSTMVEFIAGIAVVKAFGRVGHAHANYIEQAEKFGKFYRAWAMPLVTTAALSQMWISIPVLLFVNLGGGALLIDAGVVDVPQALAATLIALVLPGTIMTVTTIVWSYQRAGGAAVRLCEMLDVPVLPSAENPRKPDGIRVRVDDVEYSYGQTKALKGVSLTLEPGTVTALLGPSGSGKSTLATLIARFDDPDSGSISIGGVDLREMSQETLFSTVSFVLQDAQLLKASVRDNIALGKPDASIEEVREAARVARIDDVVMALPSGYDTVIGGDTALSGGQEQRIAIARAVLLDTPVLILDEATAMADPESEAEIQQALTGLARGKTVLVIAHRPGSIRGADQIVVLEGGRVRAAEGKEGK